MILCKQHNRPATKAWLLLHYGQYFCNSWDHEWGEVEDLEQSTRFREQAVSQVQMDHNELIDKAEALNKRRINTEDIDLIFYVLIDSIKCLHQDIKTKNAPKNEYLKLINSFVQKAERTWEELRSIRNQVEDMYKRKDYYGIFRWKVDYQLKLQEIAETKQDIKQYNKLVNAQIQSISESQEETITNINWVIKDYFYKSGKLV